MAHMFRAIRRVCDEHPDIKVIYPIHMNPAVREIAERELGGDDRIHLIEPLGFHLDEKSIKRAGMDYWSELDVTTYVNWDDFCEKNPGAKIYMATTKGRHVYTEVSYEPDCYIMFGKESAGIPEEILKANPDTCVRIPMIGETRSLNLSNSVAIVLYEALRQNQFDHMKLQGELHRLRWDD